MFIPLQWIYSITIMVKIHVSTKQGVNENHVENGFLILFSELILKIIVKELINTWF